MSEQGEYILGVDQEELDRLRFQHSAWVQEAYEIFRLAGLRAGQTVLDLGCGPGFTSLELAQVVGPTGRVIARDQSQRFLEFLRAECEQRAVRNVEPSVGTVEELDLADASVDAVYARWLFCWLPEPGEVLARVARTVRRGGVLALQEYLDWGAMKLLPRSEVFDSSVRACMQSWHEGGGRINVSEDLPALAEAAGLRVTHVRPRARVGGVGSLEWRWIGSFFQSYLPRLVERGALKPGALEAHAREWQARTRAGSSFLYTPVMADVVLTKP